MYKAFFKRFFDLVLSFAGIILLSPIFFLVWIALAFAKQGNPFFFQHRPGKNGKIFKIVKFKTMNDRKDADGKLLPDVERLTKVGSFVRKTSLDEIPQLINVLMGDMSLIGPRPLLVEYLPLYDQFERRRHDVRPGITGLAQVNGRNAIDWTTKFKYDVYYVENLSFLMDLKIIIKTLKKVFSSSEISIIPVKKLVDEKREQNESI